MYSQQAPQSPLPVKAKRALFPTGSPAASSSQGRQAHSAHPQPSQNGPRQLHPSVRAKVWGPTYRHCRIKLHMPKSNRFHENEARQAACTLRATWRFRQAACLGYAQSEQSRSPIAHVTSHTAGTHLGLVARQTVAWLQHYPILSQLLCIIWAVGILYTAASCSPQEAAPFPAPIII